MTDTLFQAYAPLILWTTLGLVLFRFLPHQFPRLLGRSLYWVGVPLEILALARQTDFSQQVGLAPVVTVSALGLGIVLSWLSLWGLTQFAAKPSPQPGEGESSEESGDPGEIPAPALPFWGERHRRGSFFLAATLGNTGFVGLAIAPTLLDDTGLGWAVFYSVTHNVIGTYGVGVFLASYFSRSPQQNHWWIQLRDVLVVPSLWAFALGFFTRSLPLPSLLESGLRSSVWLVIPGAFLLTGIRLGQLKGLQSLRMAVLPVILKAVVLPACVGCGVTLAGITGSARLAMVLMAGTPSAFAGLILAEEYDLDRELVTSSIALTTIGLLVMIPVWLVLFS